MKQLKNHIIVTALLLLSNRANAQILDFDSERETKMFVYNMQVYSQGYIGPVIDAYGSNQISGWQPSGEILQPWAFSFGVQASATFLPDQNVKFNFNEADFNNRIRLKDPSDPVLPTVLGGRTDKQLIYRVEGNQPGGVVYYEEEIPALSGITTPHNGIPGASAQIGIGLPWKTEAQLRIVPPINFYNVDHYQFAGGLRHEITQHFSDEDLKFHITLGGFYGHSKFNYEPEKFLDGKNQEIQLVDNSWNFESVFAYDMKFMSLFGIFGYYNTSTQFDILGTYEFEVEYRNAPPPAPPTIKEAFRAKDPISITANNNNVRFGAGVSFKLWNFSELSATYSYAEYHTVSAMFAIKLFNGEVD